jgi:hypothetical protein
MITQIYFKIKTVCQTIAENGQLLFAAIIWLSDCSSQRLSAIAKLHFFRCVPYEIKLFLSCFSVGNLGIFRKREDSKNMLGSVLAQLVRSETSLKLPRALLQISPSALGIQFGSRARRYNISRARRSVNSGTHGIY